MWADSIAVRRLAKKECYSSDALTGAKRSTTKKLAHIHYSSLLLKSGATGTPGISMLLK